MKWFLLLIFSLLPVHTWADWEFIGKSDKGSSFYIDYDSIEKKEHHIYFWHLMDQPEANPAGYKSIKSYEKIDCKDSKNENSESLKALILQEMVKKGIFFPPGQCFISYSHSRDDISMTLETLDDICKEIVSKVDYLLNHPLKAQRLGRNARKTALNRLDTSIIAQQHADAYQTIIRNFE